MIVGIDPGLSGALFFFDPQHHSTGEAIDLPVHMLTRGGKNKRELAIAGLIRLLALRRINHAFMEQAGAMPGQGVSGVLAFGKFYDVILGVLAARSIPLSLVPPIPWKRALNVVRGSIPKRRADSRRLLLQSEPQNESERRAPRPSSPGPCRFRTTAIAARFLLRRYRTIRQLQ